jgi:hypothetical protein
VTIPERDGLAARIRQIRRAAAAKKRTAAPTAGPDAPRVQALEERIARLERLVEGLQDSVHRESERHGKLIAELQTRVQPRAISAALSRDARERGL